MVTAKFYNSKTTHPQSGKPLELECESSVDSGVSWIRQDKSGTLHFIVYISTLSKPTFKENQMMPSHFGTFKSGKSYRLTVKSFKAEDEGTYFCTVNYNQQLYFSSGLPAFFPGQQHPHLPHLHPAPLPMPFSCCIAPSPHLPPGLPKASCAQSPGPPAGGSLLTISACSSLPKDEGGRADPAAPPHATGG